MPSLFRRWRDWWAAFDTPFPMRAPSSHRDIILAIILSVLVLIIWNYFFAPPHPTTPVPTH
jgi:hypothetical protein